MRQNIIKDEWVECLGRLRDARALILRDAEAFHDACTPLERVGQIMGGKVRGGLNDYRDDLLGLSRSSGRADSAEVERLFDVVRKARNMAVHEGAWARHLSSRLIDLFLIMEDSIMAKMTCAEDIMVRAPVVAETWHLVAHVRQSMLANSFTHLPIFVNSAWRTISDMSVMRFLRAASDPTDLRTRLSTRLEEAIGNGKVIAVEINCCRPTDTLDQLPAMLEKGPVLVTEDLGGSLRLLGIITPFDLL